MTSPRRLVCAGVALLLAVPAGAQSLGALAAKEAARRKETPPAAHTYTNDDLKKVDGLAPSLPGADAAKPDAAKPDAPASASDKPTAVPDDKKPATAEAPKDEAYWHARISDAREDLRRNQAFKDALQSRINGLSADFAARDDPYQRAQIADDRQKALAELDRVSSEIEKSTKRIADIEEEARRANVPPGWLR